MKLKELMAVLDDELTVEYWHKGDMVYVEKDSNDAYLDKEVTWLGFNRDGGLIVDFKEVE